MVNRMKQKERQAKCWNRPQKATPSVRPALWKHKEKATVESMPHSENYPELVVKPMEQEVYESQWSTTQRTKKPAWEHSSLLCSKEQGLQAWEADWGVRVGTDWAWPALQQMMLAALSVYWHGGGGLEMSSWSDNFLWASLWSGPSPFPSPPQKQEDGPSRGSLILPAWEPAQDPPLTQGQEETMPGLFGAQWHYANYGTCCAGHSDLSEWVLMLPV